MNLLAIKSIHFVGIKGVAMAALAILAKEKGIRVSGSDVEEEFPTDATLKRFGISYHVGFNPDNIPASTDLVIYTGAHQGASNPEVFGAKLRGIATLPHGIALGNFMENFRAISVAGSHGKTTTSALVASVLTTANLDPSFAVGCGEILSLKTSGHAGRGEWFVAEADEYVTDPGKDKTPRFLWQRPEILIITNIDFDHPDVYTDLKAVQAAFTMLIEKMPANGVVIANADDPPTMEILKNISHQVITYGKSKTATIQIADVSFAHGETKMRIVYEGKDLGAFTLKVPGMHNTYNAAAAIGAAIHAGLSTSVIQKGLSEFTGTKRRFETITEKHGKLLVDDYAHHPVEIKATLAAARAWYPKKKIIAIFQPHTYSRTQVLLSEFAQSFENADEVLITDIYASARETPMEGVSGKLLCQEIAKSHQAAYFVPNSTDMVEYIQANTHSNDLIITMGAGNIYTWLPHIIKAL